MFGQDGIANKIAALLAQAESTTFDGERDACVQKAAALMARHQIDQMMVNRARGDRLIDDTIDKLFIVFDHTAYHIAFIEFMTAVGDSFGFKVVWRHDRKAGWWYGFKSDLDFAEGIYASLLIQVARAADAYMKLPPQQALRRFDKHVAKRSFIAAFGVGAGRKIAEGRQIAEDEATTEHGATNLLPVLASRADQLDKYFNDVVRPGLGMSNKRGRRGDGAASTAGYNAGQRADVGQGRVGGRKALT